VLTEEKGGFEGEESGKGGFFLDLFSKLLENFVFELNDLEIVYVYHVYIFLIICS
jgi:hypothetical protein